jgi:hypothetical protein
MCNFMGGGGNCHRCNSKGGGGLSYTVSHSKEGWKVIFLYVTLKGGGYLIHNSKGGGGIGVLKQFFTFCSY